PSTPSPLCASWGFMRHSGQVCLGRLIPAGTGSDFVRFTQVVDRKTLRAIEEARKEAVEATKEAPVRRAPRREQPGKQA
ncbi:hypothetical protein ACFFFP_10350, partial [Thermus composti]